MNVKNIVIAILILIVVIGGGLYLTGTENKVVPSPSLGALAGPDIPYQWLRIGGVYNEYRSQSMRTATTSLCAMLSPAATSTLQFVSWQITAGTTTAATIDIGTSTTAFATTTNLVTATAVASGAQGYKYWTPAGAALDDAMIAPSTYLNVMTASPGLSGYTYTGTCQAVFTVL